MKKIHLPIAFLILLIGIIVLPSCEKKSFITKYDFIYGEWMPTTFDTWHRTDLKSFGNSIKFVEDHFYKIFRNDTLIGRSDFNMDVRTDLQLKIRFIPKEIFYVQKYMQMDRSPLEVPAFQTIPSE